MPGWEEVAGDTSLDLSLLLYLYASPSTDGRWYHDTCGGVFSVVAGRPIDKSLPLVFFFSFPPPKKDQVEEEDLAVWGCTEHLRGGPWRDSPRLC